MEYIERAKSLVFVVDSSDKQSFKMAANHLVEILLNSKVMKRCPKVLFVANKSDLLGARNVESVLHFVQLEAERILKSYRSESHMGHMSPESISLLNNMTKEDFTVDSIPLPFKWCSASVKNGDLSQVLSFIDKLG
ncbi:hypothetical protein X943_002975 [Babesia divergens]|uniref:Signal recognition particle receptor subunit beta n=1 Tax=Babesia divergens TaxID=32595 RepID=A0AAD9LJK1_BABDI|nr:hypothetical protein X943_002975 [Babesia divergens]